VHGLRAGAQRRLDHPHDVEVRQPRLGRTEQHHVVGERHVQGVAVGLAADGDSTDSEALQGADHAHGDLTAVGHEHAGEHHGHIRKTP
jgi:hypothetical protein